MFVILVYDVNQKRVSKIHKICKKYLRPIQRSVFEGTISQAKMTALQKELNKNIDYKEDAVCIYELDFKKYISKLQIGKTQSFGNIL